MLKEITTAVSAAVLLAAVPASAAHADPKKGDVIDIDCSDGEEYEIRVEFSNGTWSPGHLTEGNGVVRPVALDLTATFTPYDGSDPTIVSESISKNIGAGTQVTMCDFLETGSDEFGTFTVEGTVAVVVR